MGALLKLLLIAAVIVVAYYMFKFRNRPHMFKGAVLKARMKAAMDAARKVAEAEEARQSQTPSQPADPKLPVKLVACPKCGTYVAEGKACTCSG